MILQLKLLHESFLVSASFLVLCSPIFQCSDSWSWWFDFAVAGGVGGDVVISCQQRLSLGRISCPFWWSLFHLDFFYMLANIFSHFSFSIGAPHYNWYCCIWCFFNVLDTIFVFFATLKPNFLQFSCLQVYNSLTGQCLDAYSCGVCDIKYVPHILSSPSCILPCHILSLFRVSLSYQAWCNVASLNSSHKTLIVLYKDKGNRANYTGPWLIRKIVHVLLYKLFMVWEAGQGLCCFLLVNS